MQAHSIYLLSHVRAQGQEMATLEQKVFCEVWFNSDCLASFLATHEQFQSIYGGAFAKARGKDLHVCQMRK